MSLFLCFSTNYNYLLQHTYVVTFKNQTDRAYYLDTDPAHQDFKKLVLEHVSKLTVMDFEVGKGV